ncbi:MAG: hypothetical protein ACREQ1_07890 [Woeseiaceae bacterium]
MKKSICIVALAMFSAGCASSGYSPPPERRAGEQCPIGETWVCRDRYPSRMERDEEPMFCTCEDMLRVR